jgi:hypothetical protein|uniref:F-box domain-containing protein n=1 Tax=Fagus sylvatica TaxID=28930 RepID=A0A2N9F1U8_FAGSY
MELISGLPEDIARDCLIRVSYEQFSTVASVCKRWMAEVELPEFHQLRKATGHGQKVIVMAQARVEPDWSFGLMKCLIHPAYMLTIYESDTGNWRELPLAPVMSSGLPMFCQLAGVGSDLVVMGGWDPETWRVSNSVFIYNFVSNTWRRGVDMPGGPRTFFGCTSDQDRMVYVAGGHDDAKMAFRSAMMYDVAKDEWVTLPNMARGRDECKAIFHAGKFHVIGGYYTEKQGRFERSTEAFDVAMWRWDHVEEDFLEAGMCPRTCVDGNGEAVYMCMGDDVVAKEDATWQSITKLPAELCNIAYVATCHGKLVVIGSAGFGQPNIAYSLDLKYNTWKRLETPDKYSGNVQSGCYLEI